MRISAASRRSLPVRALTGAWILTTASGSKHELVTTAGHKQREAHMPAMRRGGRRVISLIVKSPPRSQGRRPSQRSRRAAAGLASSPNTIKEYSQARFKAHPVYRYPLLESLVVQRRISILHRSNEQQAIGAT